MIRRKYKYVDAVNIAFEVHMNVLGKLKPIMREKKS